jgi:DNA invertase Pin-like site-specific DNA recombinase
VSKRIGYARVSTRDQKLDLQRDALKAAGCETIFTDHGVSGAVASRPGFNKALKVLHHGDTLVVYSLSRAGRSVENLIALVRDLNEAGIAFESLTEKLDTSTAMGRAMLGFLVVLAQMERELMAERTDAGRKAARARGVRFGPPEKLTPAHVARIRARIEAGESVPEIAADLRVHRTSIYRVLRAATTQ